MVATWRGFGPWLGLCLGLAFSAVAQAGMYVYELPDGSRIITDHALRDSNYKLVRTSQQVKGIGLLVASRNPQIFRLNPGNYDHLIKQVSHQHQVEPSLIKAVMHAESAFNPYATSHKGASGLMQLMPATAQRFGVTDIYDPAQNIRAGTQYLRFLMDKFKNKYSLAVAAYNAGEGAVQRYKGIPPYPETRNYVEKVLRYKHRYRSLFSEA